MPTRLQEVHPVVVHFPIALRPTALVTGAIGQWADNGAQPVVPRRGSRFFIWSR